MFWLRRACEAAFAGTGKSGIEPREEAVEAMDEVVCLLGFGEA